MAAYTAECLGFAQARNLLTTATAESTFFALTAE